MSTTQTQIAPGELATNKPELPRLTYAVAETNDEKREALRLVADTIAQQRQVASNAIIFHPAVLGPFVALLAGLCYRSRYDWIGAVILTSGVVVAYLASVQYYTYGYLQRAESFNWKKFITPIANEPAKQDIVFYARYGDNIIATLVLRLEEATTKSLRKQRRNSSTAEIRAWSTRLRYRNAGMGGDMLRHAVAFVHSHLGPATTIKFSDSHAHAVDTTKPFTAPFIRREKKAREALAHVVKEAMAN